MYHVSSKETKYAMLWLRLLKKRGVGVQPKVPQIIAEHDGGGSDAYAALRRLERYDSVEEAGEGENPAIQEGVCREAQALLRERYAGQY